MRGMIGGMMSGGLVSVLALGVASVVSEQPAGVTPPEAPLVEAPAVDPVTETESPSAESDASPTTPVGSVTIEEPQMPDLPEGEAAVQDPAAPSDVQPEAEAPRADTDPLDEPEVVSIEGAMDAPETPQTASVSADPIAPVLPNPQSLAPQTPDGEADLTVSTAPAQPLVVVEPEAEEEVVADVAPESGPEAEPEAEPEEAPTAPDVDETADHTAEEFFVVDLGSETTQTPTEGEPAADAQNLTPEAEGEDLALAQPDAPQPRLQLQGGQNSLLSDRDTGVTVRRPGSGGETGEAEAEAAATNALVDFAADPGEISGKPLMSVILIDDGSMSAASAALSGLPFPVTIALDPAQADAAALMDGYRAAGFEVAVLAKLPEGALPADVEITFESVFRTLPESVAVLDIGDGGLQSDRAVTEQAMDILAAQGRGFVTASQGLNMAGRAAGQAGVPAAVVYRDLDSNDQDARVIRRFVDQAAFRARQESGVVLVGRVRPDTISALILWGTANQDEQVALVPLSAVLLAQ